MSIESGDESKQQIFEKVARMAASIGSPARLKILYLISQAPRSVEQISEITNESVANTSQHLQRLLKDGLVAMKKEKLQRIYRTSSVTVAHVIENLFDLTEIVTPTMSHIEGSLIDSNNDLLVELNENEMRKKSTVLIDVRDEHEVHHSPVDGAISMPLASLKMRIRELSKNKTYYLFCRGRACELATEGVKLLRAKGFKAFRLKESPHTLNNKRRTYE